MIVTIERPSKEASALLKSLHPNLKFDAIEHIEFELHWYEKIFWECIWWWFVIWISETIVPDLKKDPNFIRIRFKKSHK